MRLIKLSSCTFHRRLCHSGRSLKKSLIKLEVIYVLYKKNQGLALEPQTTKKEWLLSTTSDELIRIVVRRTDPLGSTWRKKAPASF